MGEISQNIQEKLVIVRGGRSSDRCYPKLWHVGFKILVLETECPLAIRRTVQFVMLFFRKNKEWKIWLLFELLH